MADFIKALIIVGSIIGVLIILTLTSLLSILWYHRRTQDRVDLCWALIDDKNHTVPIKGKMIGFCAGGANYLLENSLLITVPNAYPVNFIKHKRRLDITPTGDLITKDKSIMSRGAYADLIKALTLGGIGADMVKAVTGKNIQLNMILIVGGIALAVGAIGATIYQRSQPIPIQNQPAISQNVTQTNTENITIGVK